MCTAGEEFLCVALLEVEVVDAGGGAEAHLFKGDFRGAGLELFLLFEVLVFELGVVDDFAHGRGGLGGYFYQVKLALACVLQGLPEGVGALF